MLLHISNLYTCHNIVYSYIPFKSMSQHLFANVIVHNLLTCVVWIRRLGRRRGREEGNKRGGEGNKRGEGGERGEGEIGRVKTEINGVVWVHVHVRQSSAQHTHPIP